MSIRHFLPILLAGFASNSAFAAPPLPEQFLPSNTAAAIMTNDGAGMLRAWEKTQFAALANDPVLQPLIRDVDAQWRRGQVLFGTLGLNWEEIKAVASGPAAVAFVRPTPERASLVAVIECTGKDRARNAVVAKIARNVLLHRGKSWQEQAFKQPVTAFSVSPTPGAKPVTIYLFTREDLLILADDLAPIEEVLSRWERGRESLRDLPAFREIRQRCKFADGKDAHVSWFVDVEATINAARLWNPPDTPAKKDAITVLREEGFDGIKAIGGESRLADGPFDQLSRIAVFAPPPHRRAMAMLKFPNTTLARPEPWVPANVTQCVVFQWDMRDLVTSMGFLVDRKFGRPGDFVTVVDALRDDREGPVVDLRKEIIARLTGQVTMLSDCPGEVPDRGGRLLIACDCREEKPLGEALARLFKGEKRVAVRQVQGITCWEVARDKVKLPSGAMMELPPLAVAVAGNRLTISTHFSFLERILVGSGESLAKHTDFLAVDAELKRLIPRPNSFQFFSRPTESLRGPYALAQSSRLERGRTLSTRLFYDSLVNAEVTLDPAKMPPHEKWAQHLKPMGAAVMTAPEGWDIVVFTLKDAKK